MKMRKLLAILLTIAMVLAMAMLATGCGDEPSNDDDDDDDDKGSKTSVSTSVTGDGSTTSTTTTGDGTTTTTNRNTATESNALADYVEENYDELVEVLSNGAPEEVKVDVKAKRFDIIVTFEWPMLDDLTDEELDEVAESARTEMASEWAPAFWAIREDVAELESIQLEFYKSNGDYAFGAKVDEDTPYKEEDEDPDEPEKEVAVSDYEEMIIGTWETEYDLTELGNEGVVLSYTMTFRADGTVEIAMGADGETDVDEGEYYFEGGWLYIDGDAMDYTMTEDTLVLDVDPDEVVDEMTDFLFPMELTRIA